MNLLPFEREVLEKLNKPLPPARKEVLPEGQRGLLPFEREVLNVPQPTLLERGMQKGVQTIVSGYQLLPAPAKAVARFGYRKGLKPVGVGLNISQALKIRGLMDRLNLPYEGDWRFLGWGDVLTGIYKKYNVIPEIERINREWEERQKGRWQWKGLPVLRKLKMDISPRNLLTLDIIAGFMLDVIDPTDPINWVTPVLGKSVGKVYRKAGRAFEEAYQDSFKAFKSKIFTPEKLQQLVDPEMQKAIFGRIIDRSGDINNLGKALKEAGDPVLQRGFDKITEQAYAIRKAAMKADPEVANTLAQEMVEKLDKMGITEEAWRWRVGPDFITPDDWSALEAVGKKFPRLLGRGKFVEQGFVRPFAGKLGKAWRETVRYGLRPSKRLRAIEPLAAEMMRVGDEVAGTFGEEVAAKAEKVISDAYSTGDAEQIYFTAKKRRVVSGTPETITVIHPNLQSGLIYQDALRQGLEHETAIAITAEKRLPANIRKTLNNPKANKQALNNAVVRLEAEMDRVAAELPIYKQYLKAEQRIQATKALGDAIDQRTAIRGIKRMVSDYARKLKTAKTLYARKTKEGNIYISDVLDVASEGDGYIDTPSKLLIKDADGNLRIISEQSEIDELIALDDFRGEWEQFKRDRWDGIGKTLIDDEWKTARASDSDIAEALHSTQSVSDSWSLYHRPGLRKYARESYNAILATVNDENVPEKIRTGLQEYLDELLGEASAARDKAYEALIKHDGDIDALRKRNKAIIRAEANELINKLFLDKAEPPKPVTPTAAPTPTTTPAPPTIPTFDDIEHARAGGNIEQLREWDSIIKSELEKAKTLADRGDIEYDDLAELQRLSTDIAIGLGEADELGTAVAKQQVGVYNVAEKTEAPSIAKQHGLDARLRVTGGTLEGDEAAWRSMDAEEFVAMLQGEKVYPAGEVAEGNYWANRPEKPARITGAIEGKPKILVEFDIPTMPQQEALSQTGTWRNLTGAWYHDGEKWVELDLDKDVKDIIEALPKGKPTTPEEPAAPQYFLVENEKLKQLGYTDSQIQRLTPKEAARVVDEGLRAENVSVLHDGTVKVIPEEPIIPPGEIVTFEDWEAAGNKGYTVELYIAGRDRSTGRFFKTRAEAEQYASTLGRAQGDPYIKYVERDPKTGTINTKAKEPIEKPIVEHALPTEVVPKEFGNRYKALSEQVERLRKPYTEGKEYDRAGLDNAMRELATLRAQYIETRSPSLTRVPDETILEYFRKDPDRPEFGIEVLEHPAIADIIKQHESVEITELEALTGKPLSDITPDEIRLFYPLAHGVADKAFPARAKVEELFPARTYEELVEKLRADLSPKTPEKPIVEREVKPEVALHEWTWEDLQHKGIAVSKEEHVAAVKKALIDGQLTPEEYKIRFERKYGLLEQFAPEAVRKESYTHTLHPPAEKVKPTKESVINLLETPEKLDIQFKVSKAKQTTLEAQGINVADYLQAKRNRDDVQLLFTNPRSSEAIINKIAGKMTSRKDDWVYRIPIEKGINVEITIPKTDAITVQGELAYIAEDDYNKFVEFLKRVKRLDPDFAENPVFKVVKSDEENKRMLSYRVKTDGHREYRIFADRIVPKGTDLKLGDTVTIDKSFFDAKKWTGWTDAPIGIETPKPLAGAAEKPIAAKLPPAEGITPKPTEITPPEAAKEAPYERPAAETARDTGIPEAAAAEVPAEQPTRWDTLADRNAIGKKTQEVFKKSAIEDKWDDAFQDALATSVEELPPNIRGWMEHAAENNNLIIKHRKTLDDVPEALRPQFEHTKAITINGVRIEFVGDIPPSAENLRHELVHLAWRDLKKENSPVIKEALAQATTQGRQFVDTASGSAYRPAKPAEHIPEWADAKAIRKQVRQLKKKIATDGEHAAQESLKSSLELQLLIGGFQYRDMAQKLGIEVTATNEAYLTIAYHAGLARTLRLELPEEFAQEAIAYLAMRDNDMATRLFSPWADKIPEAPIAAKLPPAEGITPKPTEITPPEPTEAVPEPKKITPPVEVKPSEVVPPTETEVVPRDEQVHYIATRGNIQRPDRYGKLVLTRGKAPRQDYPSRFAENIRQVLRPHQLDAAEQALDAHETGVAFLNMGGTGSGKTMMQLAIADHYIKQGKSVLIVTDGENIIENAFQKDAKMLGVDTSQIRFSIYSARLTNEAPADIVIFDEAHKLKNADTDVHKAGMRLADAAEHVVYATATPIDRPENMWYLHKLGIFKNRRDYDDWMQSIGIEKVRAKGYIYYRRAAGVTIEKLEQGINALWDELAQKGLVHRAEVALDDMTVEYVDIDIPAAGKQKLDQLEEYYEMKLANARGRYKGMVAGQRTQAFIRHQEPYKLEAAVSTIKRELEEPNRQVIIFAQGIDKTAIKDRSGEPIIESPGTISELRKALKQENIKFSEVTGKGRKNIEAEIAAFQSGERRVIIGTPQKMGVGINLDDVAGDRPRTMILMTLPQSAMDLLQEVGRHNRITTKSPTKLIILRADTVADAASQRIIEPKLRTLGAVIQGEAAKLDITGRQVTTRAKRAFVDTINVGDEVSDEALRQRGLTRINPQPGTKIDPRIHDVTAGEGDTIKRVVQQGFKDSTTVYRKAAVEVKSYITRRELRLQAQTFDVDAFKARADAANDILTLSDMEMELKDALKAKTVAEDAVAELRETLRKKRLEIFSTTTSGAALIPLSQPDDDDDSVGWKRALLYSLALIGGGAYATKKFGKRLLQWKRAGKFIFPDIDLLDKTAKSLAETTQKVRELRLESLRLEAERKALEKSGIKSMPVAYIGQEIVKESESYLAKIIGKISPAAKDLLTRDVPYDVRNTYDAILYNSRYLGMYGQVSGKEILQDIEALMTKEGLNKGLGEALAKHAEDNQLYAPIEITAGLATPRQQRLAQFASDIQELQENFGRYVKIDDINAAKAEFNAKYPTSPITTNFPKDINEWTSEQWIALSEINNSKMVDLLRNINGTPTIDDIPYFASLSPEGKKTAVNIVARIGSLYEFARSHEAVARAPWGYLSDWLSEENLQYAYHMYSREAKKIYREKYDLRDIVGTVRYVRANPYKSLHDEARKFMSDLSIREINRLGRVSSDKNIAALSGILRAADIDAFVAAHETNPIIQLAKSLDRRPEEIYGKALAYKAMFGKPLKQTLIEDPNYLTALRMNRAAKIGRTGELVTEMLKLGIPKELAPKAWRDKPKLHTLSASIPEAKGLYFEPEVVRMIDKALLPKYQASAIQQYAPYVSNILHHALVLFKSNALATTAFTFMNIAGAAWQNFVDGVGLTGIDHYDNAAKYILGKLDGYTDATGRVWSKVDLDKVIQPSTYSTFIASELGKPLSQQHPVTTLAYKMFAGDFPWGQALPPATLHKINDRIEAFMRAANIFHKLDNGFSATDATRFALGAQYDYATDSFGKLWQWSFKIFPFIKWPVRNIPYSFAKLFTRPGRMRTELFNFPETLGRLGEMAVPADTSLAFAPEYVLDRMPVAINIYTDDKGKDYASFWFLDTQLPHSEIPIFDANPFSEKWRRDVGEWAETLLSKGVGEIASMLRPELQIPLDIYAGRQAGTNIAIKSKEQSYWADMYKYLAMKVVPLARLIRFAQLSGVDIPSMKPAVRKTRYEAITKGKHAYLIKFFLGGKMYVYDPAQEQATFAIALKRARLEAKSTLRRMVLRGYDKKQVRKQATQMFNKLREQIDEKYQDITTKGGR